MKKELIIFDLDGTLVNSIPDLTDALNHASSLKVEHKFNETEVEALVGGGVANLIEKAFNISKADNNYKSHYNDFIEYYNNNYSNRSYLYENVEYILDYYSNKKLAVLSNKLEYYTKQVCIDFGISKRMSLIMGASKNHEIKPSPEPILHMLKELNIKPSMVVMVGDSEADIMCAKNAGISSIALSSGYRSKESLLELNPDFMIDDIKDLTTIIE